MDCAGPLAYWHHKPPCGSQASAYTQKQGWQSRMVTGHTPHGAGMHMHRTSIGHLQFFSRPVPNWAGHSASLPQAAKRQRATRYTQLTCWQAESAPARCPVWLLCLSLEDAQGIFILHGICSQHKPGRCARNPHPAMDVLTAQAWKMHKGSSTCLGMCS